MISIIRALALTAAMALLAAGPVRAQLMTSDDFPVTINHPLDTEPVRHILPRAGAYYSPASSGSGLLLEVGRQGFLFGAFFYHREDGQRDWLIVNGNFEPSAYVDWLVDGRTGQLESPRLETTGGPAGFNAQGGQPSTTAVPGAPVRLTWYGPDRIRVEWDGRVQELGPLRAIEANSRLDDRLIGKWRLSVIRTSGHRTAFGSFRNPRTHELATGELSIEAAEPPPGAATLVPQGEPLRPLPPPGARWYRVVPTLSALRGYNGSLNTRYDLGEMRPQDNVFDYWIEGSVNQPDRKHVVTWASRWYGLQQTGIVYDPVSRTHLAFESTTRCPTAGAPCPLRRDHVVSQFYFLTDDRVLVREWREREGGLSHHHEILMDRVTPDIEHQRVQGCARVLWDSAGSWRGIQMCGRDGQWP